MTDPNVVYDFTNRQITVEVVVEDQIVAALPVLTPGPWTVTWKLQTSLNPSPIFCSEHGIKIHLDKPDELSHGEPYPVLDDPDGCWRISFVNNCLSANAVSYDINLQPGNAACPDLEERAAKLKYHHDPSISVVSDPPNG